MPHPPSDLILTYRLYRLLWSALDWFYPPFCGGCGTAGSRWCEACQEATLSIQPPLCELCGKPDQAEPICPVCANSRPAYVALRSYSIFTGPLQNALHRLKYRKDVGLGEALARPLGKYLVSLGWNVDIIVPIPLGRERKRERGYNQVGLLGLPLALSQGISYRPAGLSRIRETRSQVGLHAADRLTNVRGAFLARQDLVLARDVLLLDDVTTTGATLEAGAEALLQAGAREVYALSLARTPLSKNPLPGSPVRTNESVRL